MFIRVAAGRAPVAREIRAATPLMSDLAAPVTARAPWLTAALNVQSAPLVPRDHPRAVVVGQHPQGRPEGLALLSARRRGPTTVVTLLGSAAGPVPGGRPPARLHARDDAVAGRLADGVLDLLDRVRGPWALRLSGLPLGDPTLRHLAASLRTAQLANGRSRRLVDDLDSVAEVIRTRDPARLERWLPAVLALVEPADRPFVRANARLQAGIGALELAVVPGRAAGGPPAAVLLTLVEGPMAGSSAETERWPWWGSSTVGGLRRELGSPVVTLTAGSGLRFLGRTERVSGAPAPR